MPTETRSEQCSHAAICAQQFSHTSLVMSQWGNFRSTQRVYVDGESLSLANVTAVARGKAKALISPDSQLVERIEASVAVLQKRLSNGEIVYGVNTGYGGSADVRCETHQMQTMQRSLLQLQHTGILPISPSIGNLAFRSNTVALTLPEHWVRAAMLIRANSLVRGHSAVRGSTVKALLTLLDNDVVPLIPNRGSISASGDLQPLSYIAGLLEGNPEIYCWTGSGSKRRIITAPEALQSINLPPTEFEPKEALGLVNGTAVSCAAGALTLNSMNHLFALSQLLTAMNVEALLGTATSFAPFISQVRPHTGQAEVASFILSALNGSKLASPVLTDHASSHTLFQDRYSLRTAPQWLGPFAEDLVLANKQIEVEMNSTTDNPLIDPGTGDIYHGGNFQAVSVTTAMEKTRLAAQAVGRMLFSQFTEMVNHATNRGLPPNLSADDPSTCFTLKGVDINMAAYISELCFLANPVHTHVQTAEMGNQSLNSLALISARYTEQSVEILTMMCAATLYGVCQALDLRAMIYEFEWQLRQRLESSLDELLGDVSHHAKQTIWRCVKEELDKTTAMDVRARFKTVFSRARVALLDNAVSGIHTVVNITSLQEWFHNNAEAAALMYNEVRERYFSEGDATHLLAPTTAKLYNFVREGLAVPMNKGVIDHPTVETFSSQSNGTTCQVSPKHTIGHWISVIFEAIKHDIIMDVVGNCLVEHKSRSV